MKHCPACNRVETDDTLAFCRADGTLLIRDSVSVPDETSEGRNQDESAPTKVLDSDTSHNRSATSTLEARAAAVPQTEELKQPRAGSAPRQFTSITKQRRTTAAIVLAVVVLTLAVGGYFYFTRSTRKAIDSIAVLPFENKSADPDTDYLSDGLTESLIYRLSQLPSLRVSPRSTVFRYKGKETDAINAGNELGVSAVVSGRIMQRGDSLTISAELVDLRDNKLLWGEQYDRKTSDLLQTQREIAEEIAAKLKIKVSGDEKGITKHYTESNEAYQLYLKGRYYWNKRTREGYKKAIEHFEQAIEKDPSYALAYTGLADCYNVLSSYGLASPNESFPKARAAAARAVEIDGDLAEAQTSLAYVKYQFDWNWSSAESGFKRAIELNPNYATAHQWYALLMAGMGRFDEATQEMKRAQDLDPLALIANVNLGWILYHARQYDQAIIQMRRSLDMDPNFARAHWAISEPYVQQQKYVEAISELLKARQMDDTPTLLALLGHAYAVSGRKSEAQKILNDLRLQSRSAYVDPYFLAQIYVGLKEPDRAFQELENAYNQRSSWLVWLKVEPKFDSLRSDPRFTNLVRRVGLTP